MEQIILKLNDTLYNPLLILETFNNIKLPKWLGRAMLSDLLIASRVIPKMETPKCTHPNSVPLTNRLRLLSKSFNYVRDDCI